jgi:putative endonuclease
VTISGGYVYIATNKSRMLYIGLTNDLERRMSEHKHKIGSKFTIKYNITRLVYYEAFDDIRGAIAREKQLKRWRRERKSELALNTSEGPGEGGHIEQETEAKAQDQAHPKGVARWSAAGRSLAECGRTALGGEKVRACRSNCPARAEVRT